MNTNDKGRIAELIAQAKYIELGYTVLQPINKDGVYDFVIEKCNKYFKIQVKVAKDKDEFYQIRNQKVSSGVSEYYKDGDYDYLVGVDIELKDVFEIPFSKCTKGEVRLRKQEIKSNQRKLIKFASDFKI